MLEKLALQKKLISKQDCLKAMQACKSSPNYEMALKDYFVTNNLIPEKTIIQLIKSTNAIKIMKSTMRFGSVAIKLGFISKKILDAALSIQKKSISENKNPKRVGQILLDAGKLSKAQITRVIQEQKKLSQSNSSPKESKKSATETPVTKPPEPKEKIVSEPEVPEAEIEEPESVSIDTETQMDEDPGTREESIEGGMLLEVEDGGMSAYLKKTDTFDDNLIVEDIISILLAKNIQFGIVNESAIEGFINSKGFKTNRFKIAAGKERVPGRDARVEYFFDTDHLKAGDLDDEGNIDFKNRGKIPRVEINTLLAERFPMEEAVAGRDIYGNELSVNPVSDTQIKALSGVIVSQDGRYAHAEVSGHPKLSRTGDISVVDSYLEKGDVGYKTGHLMYDGDIEVKGCVKSGFRVNGYDVKVKEVDGGEINAQGDVTILDGVNGARIFARGHVSANFIHDSEVYCLGNVYIQKEIVDSKVRCSGSCLIKTGKIINSHIASNQGVHVKDVGTEKTSPNTVIVGQDLFIKNELVKIEKQIIETEKQKIKFEKRKDNLELENNGFQQSSTKAANELDQVVTEIEAIEAELVKLKDDESVKKERSALKNQLKQKQSLLTRLDKQLGDVFNDIEKNNQTIEEIHESFDILDDKIEDLNRERENYLDWKETNPGKSVVTVEGKVYASSIIQGQHASKEIKDTETRVQIKECQISGEGANANLFEIQIHDNIKKR